MQFTGIIEKGLGGFTTIRGYSTLENLARASKAEEFQRVLIESHIAELKEFLRKKIALYFPEIVLAYTLKYDYGKGVSGTNPMQDILDKKVFESNVDQVKFKPIKIEPRKQRIVQVTINDKWLEANKPFSIIDGNHRINAFLEGNIELPYEPFLTPFSLLLFEDNERSNKNKRLIFTILILKPKSLQQKKSLRV